MIALTKIAETSTTITLGWQPPAGVECYAFFANEQKVSLADDKLKDGSARTSVKFNKTLPGPPFAVVALTWAGGAFAVDLGTYPSTTAVYPSPTTYPRETL